MRPRWYASLVVACVLALGVVSTLRADQIVESPGLAAATGTLLSVDGAAPRTDGEGTFLLLAVTTYRASLLESWLQRFSADSVLVPTEQYYAPGQDEQQRRQEGIAAMDQSQEFAVAVAERAAGRPVRQRAEGARILSVLPESKANGVLAPGDLVTAVDGQPVTSDSSLREAIAKRRVGDEIRLGFTHDGAKRDARVALVRATEGPSKGGPLLGVTSQVEYTFDFPVRVKFADSGIIGPSGGLAFTLTVYDALTPGDLAGGRAVAVTGTIGLDGTVGPIGGAREKVVSARKEGAALVLVPTANLAEARSGQRDGRPAIVGVATFDDALRALGARSA